VAVLAGAEPGPAIRIGLAMTLLQLGIGTLNDVVDAPADAGVKPGKPIPAGLVDPGAARRGDRPVRRGRRPRGDRRRDPLPLSL
jgi:4-hydroxybenzoate polyprenyltransferase